MTFLFYFQPFLLDGYFITQNERSIRFILSIMMRLCFCWKRDFVFLNFAD